MCEYFDSESTLEPFEDSSGIYLPDAAECMRCGLCVSQCPTYHLFKTHEESPRGRVRTLSKMLMNGDSISTGELSHLDNCLQCRACEAVCPSRMAYGRSFDQARLSEARQVSMMARLAFSLIKRKKLRQALLPFIRRYIRSGLQSFTRHIGLLSELNLAEADALAAVPELSALALSYPARHPALGTVGLFAGCLGEHFDRETLNAAIRLLNAVGYDILVPPEQTCCGAIHQHNGRQADALAFSRHNQAIFNGLDVDAIVFTATGCGAMLSEYPQVDNDGQRFHARLYDINDFLLQHWPERLTLSAADLKVAVHEPCSQRNVLKNQSSVYALLQKIPELCVQPLADNHLCCGSGGSYMLTHPDNAGRLRALKLESIAQAKPDRVVSANFGCALYLNAGSDVKVVHPLLLLATQLPGFCS